MASAGEQPSQFYVQRWSIYISMYIGYTLYIMDRKSFSFAMPAIMREEGLEKDDLGLIMSSQTLAYTVSKFLGGIVADQISARQLFSLGLFLSGVANVLFTACSSSFSYSFLWFVCGFVQGGGWPSCAKIMRKWYYPSEFGTLWSVLSTAMNLACSIGPIIASLVIVNFGWRSIMQAFGLLSVLFSGVCLVTLVDCPEDVGLEPITTGDKAKDDKSKRGRGRGTWQDLLRSPLLWVIGASYMAVYMVRTATLDWGQLYIIQQRGHSQYTGSMFISFLEMGGIVGSVVAGYAGDKFVAANKRDDLKGSPRMAVAMMFVVGIVMSLQLMIFTIGAQTPSVWILMVGFVLGFCIYGPVALYGVMAMESAPSHLAGTSHAFVGLAANVGSILAGLPFSICAKYWDWSGSFIILEVLVVCIFVMKFLTRNMEYKMIAIKKKLQ